MWKVGMWITGRETKKRCEVGGKEDWVEGRGEEGGKEERRKEGRDGREELNRHR